MSDTSPLRTRLWIRATSMMPPGLWQPPPISPISLGSTDRKVFRRSAHCASNRVVPNYNVMGPVKAALEAACRYLAYELGPQRIRVHAISPGPMRTRAASGLKDFEVLLNEAAAKAPVGDLVDIMDVGFTCAYLATPFAHRLTGGTVYVDGGANIVA